MNSWLYNVLQILLTDLIDNIHDKWILDKNVVLEVRGNEYSIKLSHNNTQIELVYYTEEESSNVKITNVIIKNDVFMDTPINITNLDIFNLDVYYKIINIFRIVGRYAIVTNARQKEN